MDLNFSLIIKTHLHCAVHVCMSMRCSCMHEYMLFMYA